MDSIINVTRTRTNTTSRFTMPTQTMPTYGHAAFGMLACAQTQSTAVLRGTDVTVREGRVAAIAKGAFPGSLAWRPPIC